MTSPGFSGAVWPSVTRPRAVADVITVKSNKLFAGLWRLLLFTELVVFPSALVLPQLPVSTFRPGDRWVRRKRELREIYEPYSLCQFQHLKFNTWHWFHSLKYDFIVYESHLVSHLSSSVAWPLTSCSKKRPFRGMYAGFFLSSSSSSFWPLLPDLFSGSSVLSCNHLGVSI